MGSLLSSFAPVLSHLMDSGSGAFSIGNFLNGLNNSLFNWGKVIVVIIGVVMVIVGVFNIAKGLMSGGRGQVNWVLNLVLFFVGGALAFSGGWGLVQNVSEGGNDTLYQMANGGESSIVIEADTVNTAIGDLVSIE
jgi:hypothetical protein